MNHGGYSFLSAGAIAANPTAYLAQVANCLKDIAATLGHGLQVDQIRLVSNSLKDFKFWMESFIDFIFNENYRVLADFVNRLNGLHIQNVPAMENVPITMLREAFGKRALNLEEGYPLIECSQKAQLDIIKHNSPSHEPDGEPLASGINHREISEEREAKMKAHLEKTSGISKREMRSWVMLAMGIVSERKNSDYLVMHLKEMAAGRGGHTLVKLMEFEIGSRASERIYEKDVEKWNDFEAIE